MKHFLVKLRARIKATLYIWRYRNFILVYNVHELKDISGKVYGRQNAYLRRTDHDTESDFYTMKSSMLHQFGTRQLDDNRRIGNYKPLEDGNDNQNL